MEKKNRFNVIINALSEKGQPKTGDGGGQEAGKLDISKTPFEKVSSWVEGFIKKNKPGFDLDKELPNLEKNYNMAKKKAMGGKTKRREMPVIEEKDVKKLQWKLKEGRIDINKPFAEDTDPSDPFPEGLKGKEAQEFLSRGLKDGSKDDDVVKVTEGKKKVKDLVPIQRQIYVDKSLGDTIKFGIETSLKFIQGQIGGARFIVSSDNRIIDGHHRFLSGMILDPNMMVPCIMIDLPISKLLPMSLAFGDAVGNERNK